MNDIAREQRAAVSRLSLEAGGGAVSGVEHPVHEAVMVDEVLGFLASGGGGLVVDCTVGLGGHARALIDAGASRVIGLDRDPSAIAAASARLAPCADRVELVHRDYREIEAVLDERGISRVDGVLADLGVSSMQLEAAGRGFSFRRDEPLDMRMDTSTGETAAEALGSVDEATLADVIFRFGEERYARRIARAIVHVRAREDIETTGQLATIVRRVIPVRGYSRIDPATRTFQALRIWVNGELDGLDRFLAAASRRLSVGARLVVIAFHSLEDRVVKHTLRALQAEEDSNVRVVTKRPITPTEAEVARNPRARSAKLRVAERPA
jgi:16S rRNA (cytosine1402-N4)-methyltransferase